MNQPQAPPAAQAAPAVEAAPTGQAAPAAQDAPAVQAAPAEEEDPRYQDPYEGVYNDIDEDGNLFYNTGPDPHYAIH
ncbi:hypothetical protein CAEBREN_23626 [Caenorhabditis brenneri]|uniref:Uncharacterized protein n=1 Tax=Caenorhabditis brenneri TaxID=135651 RepID=G0MHG6_CAEBE|nr:hypothetical protein CAEBREN_23626 [Caenorhabditis brenneri]